ISKKAEKLSVSFFVGFALAMAGICLISFGNSKFEFKPIGDLLAVIAAFVWAVYSVLTKKISNFGFSTILTTRRIFAYGILFMLPTLFFFDFRWELAKFTNRIHLLNLLFLGLGASALCFVTWNFAVKRLGAVKTSIYIYLVPVITVAASILILREQITISTIIGTVLTMAGLFLSEIKFSFKKRQIRDS
ncbi:MAG: DMT family transporter, partial [Lachnospiraceae bacterium]|nr:DMT family transporter [Lachnospiraceae bacterium]